MPPKAHQWLLPLLLAATSLVVSGWVGYTHNDKDLTGRVIKIETHQTDDDQRLERIEHKIDRILENQQHH